MLSTRILRRAVPFGLVALTLVMLAGIGGKVAAAANGSCAEQVIADWYDDGRVGKIYPLACYQQAIKKLPPDVLDYSNAKEEIGRALAFARQGKPDPGGQDPTPVSTTATTSTATTKTTTTKTTSTKTDTTKTTTTPPYTSDSFTPGTTSTTDTSGPSSVPVPLLILGGLAILLLAAGSAGYLRRRMGGGGGDGGSPPAGV